ncbi:MAG TPA: RNA 2',3'-cyclic phosphodiesterase [Anaerolineales bacterium]|nr:RNA 2',3'-cyclic phosphodiesterase [Anaerolineales bacterium]
MSVIRAFIAVELPPDLLSNLAQVSALLQSRLEDRTVRWIPTKNIHLTLKFLGDVSVKNLDILKEALAGEVAQYQPMEFSVGGLGAFPKIRRPRVIWVGVEAPPELLALQRSIEARMAKIGYPLDKRAFAPHLTIGRVNRSASPEDIRRIGDVLNDNPVSFLGAVRVQEIHLFRSDLRPSGAVYSKIFTASLVPRD